MYLFKISLFLTNLLPWDNNFKFPYYKIIFTYKTHILSDKFWKVQLQKEYTKMFLNLAQWHYVYVFSELDN